MICLHSWNSLSSRRTCLDTLATTFRVRFDTIDCKEVLLVFESWLGRRASSKDGLNSVEALVRVWREGGLWRGDRFEDNELEEGRYIWVPEKCQLSDSRLVQRLRCGA